ncbi:hypothetical protein QA641_07675 [Bradyrhizobium sp. CB1650]|uniref:hypothetical protein n=1 Tax=Bradyrhizobium sp. CB1650 TaxID=3039153 RepID=UPI002435D6AD|nr:hypothetical protein [Bradyrhizobium sp. CB1650]WGD53765.1 hypothetical protein QA641_07675 [Bradyrhizobium sp. CB1650]
MAGKSIWQNENTSGFEFDRPWKWMMLPGVVIQWFLYMFPSGTFGRVVSDTRVSRSPLMTYFLSALFYLATLATIAALLSNT